jgi:hypothetical protein
MKKLLFLLFFSHFFFLGCMVYHTDKTNFYNASSETNEGVEAINAYNIKYLSKNTWGLFWFDIYRKKGMFVYDIKELADGSTSYKIIGDDDVERLKLSPEFGLWNRFGPFIFILAIFFWFFKDFKDLFKSKGRALILLLSASFFLLSCVKTNPSFDDNTNIIKLKYPNFGKYKIISQKQDNLPVIEIDLSYDTITLNAICKASPYLIEKLNSKKKIIKSVSVKRFDNSYVLTKIEVVSKFKNPVQYHSFLFYNSILNIGHHKSYNYAFFTGILTFIILCLVLIYFVGFIDFVSELIENL